MRASLRRAGLAAVVLGACACAGTPERGRGDGALAALDALVVRSDAAGAAALASRHLARAPGDPLARLAAALLARRGLDPAAEAGHLVALAASAPGHPLALVALRRLGELADESPAIAGAIEDGLAPPLAAGALSGVAAYRARVARIAAAEALGEHGRAARLRADNGSISAWTLAGPFGVRRAFDFALPLPPDGGALPLAAPAPFGGAPRPTRTLPAPDGTIALEGEPGGADVFYLAADVTLATGGRYLLSVGTSMSARVHVDGALAHERLDYAAHLPTVVHVPVALAPGVHRVLVKVARAGDRAGLHLALAREDGAPSDVTSAPAPPGAAPPAAAPPGIGEPVHGARAIAAALERALEPGLGSYLAGLDAAPIDREGAKALLAEAAEALPASAAVRVARAGVIASDPTLDGHVARSRAEGELREALARDAGHGAARVALAAILRGAGRLDEADELLAAAAAQPRPAAPALALELARLAAARGLPERAEALVAEAIAAGGGCRALELGRELAGARGAVALEDGRTRSAAGCRDGRERLSEHLRRRGDLAGAEEALLPVVRARPWAIEPALALAAVHVAAGSPGRGAAVLEAALAIWPRSGRLQKRLADLRELGGDAAAARAARERALLLDGGDLGLRRALALEEGREVLDGWAEDASSAIRAYEAARRTDDTSSAMVLDAAAVEHHRGGAFTERVHQVIHVLDREGVDQFGEVTVPPGAQVLALRTLKPDGKAVEPERVGGKDSVSLAGLEPGDYVRLEYLRAFRADGDGAAAEPFFFRADGSRLFRSTYAIVAPEGLGVTVDAHGTAPPAPLHADGREVFRVTAWDVPAHVPEPGQPSLLEIFPYLQAGVGGGREVVHADLADAVAGKARSTEELRAFARRVRAEAGEDPTPGALARAAWARVSRDILGNGGAFGEDASEILSRGRGSRLTVLRAVLAELGIRARVALARPFAADPSPRRFPSHASWSQPLLRMELGEETVWHDPALRSAPLGTVPSPALDVEALLLPEPGEPLEVVRTPERPIVEERREVVIRIALRPDGGAALEGEDRYHGAAAAAGKAMVERLDATERRQVIEASLARSFPDVSLDSAEMDGEQDPRRPFVIRWRGTAPSLARASNGGLVLDAPVVPARLGARYVQVAARTTPLVVPLTERVDARVEVIAPEGLVPAPAQASAVDGEFGSFARAERADGRTLVNEERLVLRRGRVAPARYADFASFATTVDHLQERAMTVVAREAPPVGPAAPASAGAEAP
jgi:hypothetical protein